MRRLTHFILGVASLGASLVGAGAAETPSPLRVAVCDVPPYGFAVANGEIDGISVDLWRRVAGAIDRRYTLTPVADMEAVLGGLEQRRFDAAIGAITITPEREARVDFSYPAHRSGAAMATRREAGPLSAAKAPARHRADEDHQRPRMGGAGGPFLRAVGERGRVGAGSLNRRTASRCW